MISVSILMDDVQNVYFANNFVVINFNKRFIYNSPRVYDLFVFGVSYNMLQQTELNNVDKSLKIKHIS